MKQIRNSCKYGLKALRLENQKISFSKIDAYENFTPFLFYPGTFRSIVKIIMKMS